MVPDHGVSALLGGRDGVQDPPGVVGGPTYIPFVDFTPTLQPFIDLYQGIRGEFFRTF